MSRATGETFFTLSVRVQPPSLCTRDIVQRMNVTLVESDTRATEPGRSRSRMPGRILQIGSPDCNSSPFNEFLHALGQLLVQLHPELGAAPADTANPKEPVPAQAMPDQTELVSSCGLSRREQEVLEHVLAGHLNKQTAYALMISPRTVEHYRAAAMLKIGAHSAADLFRMTGYQTGRAR